MNRPFQRTAIASACVLLLSPGPSRAGNQFTESFTATTYKDAVNTTADWNTAAGELRLFPFAPSLVGGYDTPGIATGVAVAGDLAFVADYSPGLQIINITNPASPTIVGSYSMPDYAFSVAVAGDLAFVADLGAGLQIINVVNPASPTVVGSYNTPGFARGVAVAGDLAFVADGTFGLQIINIINPASPTLVGNYDTPGNAWGVAVAGDLAFVADNTGGLQIINIINPASPTLVGSHATPTGAFGVAVDGDLAFVAASSSGLQIISISNPASPTLVGTYNTPGDARGIAMAGDLAFVGDDDFGLQIIDITNPALPTLVDSYDTLGNSWGVAVDGDLAFVADDASGLQIIRISDALGTLALAGSYTTPGLAYGAAVVGDLAYIADGIGGLHVIDITNPASPTLFGALDTSGFAQGIAVAGDLAFVAASDAGLDIIDITNPAIPTLVGTFDTSGYAEGVAVAGDLAFVADEGDLKIIDITNPASPTLAGSCDPPGIAHGVAVAGDLAFVASDVAGLQIINIANPSTPTLVGSYNTPGSSRGVAIAGDLAFVADGASGLQIIDIANPANPTLTASYDTPGYANSVAVAGDFVFVADGASGLQIIGIADPLNPTLTGSYIAGSARCVAVGGELAFLGFGPWFYAIQVFQHEAVSRRNVGQSLAIDEGADVIGRVRLSTTPSANVSWEVSANAGTNWQPITPNTTTWTRFATPGNDLLWRSTHTWAPGLNPTVSDLHLEWLYESASIASIADVPNDQGGRVYVDWTRSAYDFTSESTYPVAGYNLYRRVDNLALSSAVQRDASDIAGKLVTSSGEEAFSLPGMRAVSRAGQIYVIEPSDRATTATFPPGTWALVGTAFATQSAGYRAEATTEADSSASGTHHAVYLVTTHTTTPSVWFVSPSDSGYSLDNLAPAVPTNFAIAYNTGNGNTLAWDESPDADFQYFRVYRSTDPNFTPSAGTLVHSTITNGWADPDYDGWPVYYKVTATDYAGNESAPASGGATTGVDGPKTPRTFALYPNAPNPFNPTTMIRYDVPNSGSNVSLRIYDVSGRLVKTLVEGVQTAGEKSVTWNGRDDTGRPVASGMYFYRLAAPNYTKTRKMVLMK